MSNLNKMYFSLSVLVLGMLTALQLGVTEGPPRKLASEGVRQIIFAYVNESVTLKCPVESSSDFQTFIDWTKGNMSLYMMQGYEITPKGYLKIKSVSNEHSGIYTCEAVNGYGTVRVNLTLVVDNPESASESYTMTNRNSAHRTQYYPPVITKRPAPFTVDVGGEATFHCIATGQPLPHIFWLKDGYLIEGSNTYASKRKAHSILKLKELKKSDAGDYKCIARSKAGEDEMDYTLQVTEPSPPPRIIALDPLKVTVREGSSITFVCEVASRVQVHIKWLKKLEDVGESVELSDVNLFRSGRMYYRSLNFTDSEFVTNGGIYKSKLLIRDSCETDSGTYVCLALNDKGFNFKNSTLKVIGRSNALATTPHFPANTTSLIVTIIVAAVVILSAVVFIAHLCCRNKSSEKRRNDRASIPNIETGSVRQSTASVRKPNKCDLNPFPDIGEPRSTSRLLGIDSGYMYEHTESKSIQERTSFH